MQQLLTNPMIQNKQCFLMGDFNVDLLKCKEDLFCQDFFDTLLSFSFIPLITRPTRLSSHSSTLIDNIFSNVERDKLSLNIQKTHRMIFSNSISALSGNVTLNNIKN